MDMVKAPCRIVRFAVILLFAMAGGCRPEFDDRLSIVLFPRVLAVQSIPAEAAPKDPVAYRALVAVPEGLPSAEGDLDWALCRARKPLTELGPVSPACLIPQSPDLVPIGNGATAMATLPADDCRLFGPDPPEPQPGEPAGRPVDPDPTGGYYAPVRVRLASSGSVVDATGQTRLVCDLAQVTREQLIEYRKSYRTNENPAIGSLTIERPSGEEVLAAEGSEAGPTHVRAGERLTLRAGWSPCPAVASCGDGICGEQETAGNCAADCTRPRGCSGAEPYVFIDPLSRKLLPKRESIRVSWFSASGSFDSDHTGRPEEEADTPYSDNGWTAPATPGRARIWVVLRDDRGGVGWQSYAIAVDGPP
jgi:hypothetical protein